MLYITGVPAIRRENGELDFESGTSANSITPARVSYIIIYHTTGNFNTRFLFSRSEDSEQTVFSFYAIFPVDSQCFLRDSGRIAEISL